MSGAVLLGRRGTLAVPFSMKQLRPRLWYDASQIAASHGDLMAAVSDLSGNGDDLTAAGAARPTFQTNVQNGRPGLLFAGSQGMATATLAALPQPNTVLLVCSHSSATGRGWCDGIATGHRGGYLGTGVTNFSIFAGTTVNSSTAPPFTASVFSGLFSGASSNGRRNGTTLVSGNAGTNDLTGVTLGCHFALGANTGIVGYIHEYVLLPYSASAAVKSVAERALGRKWGITVA